MPSKQTNYFMVTVYMTCWTTTAGQGSCVTSDSIASHALTNHDIRHLTAKKLRSCITACQSDTNCYSVNYHVTTRVCELNSRTRHTHPRDLTALPGWTYMEVIDRHPGVACSKETCVNGFCDRDPAESRYKICRCFPPFYGESCEVCTMKFFMSLGMERRGIKDSHINASSFVTGKEPYKARLNVFGCWMAAKNNTEQYLEISFVPDTKIVTKIATQGDPRAMNWVTEYTIEYSPDGRLWSNYTTKDGNVKHFRGNRGMVDTVDQLFHSSFRVAAIRIRPTNWFGHIALRVELYGY